MTEMAYINGAVAKLPDLPEPLRNRDTKNKPRPNGDYETEWNRCTKQARELWLAINKNKLAIAEHALSVCEISYGGGNHWKNFENIKTLKQFAEESGIAYRTLHKYVGIKKMSDRLPEGKFDERNWTAAGNAYARTTGISDLTDEDVIEIYEQEINRKGSSSRLSKCLKYAKAMRNHLLVIDWDECFEDETQVLSELLSECADLFNGDHLDEEELDESCDE